MTTIDNRHFLAVGDDGNYSKKGKYQSAPDQVQLIVNHLKQRQIKELSIYFHGGLVNELSAEKSITRVFEALAQRNKPDSEALSFIWKTGFLETVRDNLDEIFSSKFGRSLLKWAIRAVSKKLNVDLAKAGTNKGISLKEIEDEWEASTSENRVPFRDLEIDTKSKAKGNTFSLSDEEDPDLEYEIRAELEQYYASQPSEWVEDWEAPPQNITTSPDLNDVYETTLDGKKGIISVAKLAKAIAKISFRVIKRYAKDSDHGLQATVVEETCRAYFVSDAGQWVWGSMKQKAQEMWLHPGCVGFDFMNLLQQELPNLRLNLIGHSAGSIAICHFLGKKRQNHWKTTIEKILWWAPACRADIFVQEVIHHDSDFDSFRMVTMTDPYELEDKLVNSLPWLYPSSLLYFISGVLEEEADEPIAGMARYHINTKPYTSSVFTAMEEFLSKPGYRVLSKTEPDALPGFRSHALEHGAFNEDELTLQSLTRYLS